MNKSYIGTMAAMVCSAILGGTLAYTPTVQAQIDFSVLDKWRGLDAQKGPAARPAPNVNSPKPEQSRQPTAKEQQKAREQAQRLVASIRDKLIMPGPQASVTVSRTSVAVPSTGGYLNTPPSPAGVFAAIAAGAAKTPATAMTPLALRRSAAILAAAVDVTASEETSAFLASEAATALQGGTVRVRVDDAAFKWNDRREERFRALLHEAEESFRDMEFAKGEQARVDKEVQSIARKVQDKTLSAAQAETMNKALSETLDAALKRGREAQKKIQDLPKKMKYVVEVVQ